MTTTKVQVLKFTKEKVEEVQDPKILAMSAVVRARNKAIEKQLAFGAPMGNDNAAKAHEAMYQKYGQGTKEEANAKILEAKNRMLSGKKTDPQQISAKGETRDKIAKIERRCCT